MKNCFIEKAEKLQYDIEKKFNQMKSKSNGLKDVGQLLFIILLMASFVSFIYFTFVCPTNVWTTKKIPILWNPLHMFGITIVVFVMYRFGDAIVCKKTRGDIDSYAST